MGRGPESGCLERGGLEKWGAKAVEGQKKVWGAKRVRGPKFRVFPFRCLLFSPFFFLSLSLSLGVFSWNFGGV